MVRHEARVRQRLYLNELHPSFPSIVKHAILLYGINGSICCSTSNDAASVRATLSKHLLS